MADDLQIPPLARALGRIPTGLYIVSTVGEGPPLGFVGSFVMQVGFEPPTVCVAVGKDREHLEAMRASGRFSISILDDGSRKLMGTFFKPFEDGEGPFDELEHRLTANGLPVLTQALAWLDCELSGEHETGDHVVVFGRVVEAQEQHEGSPSIHLRKDGLSY